MKKGFLLSFILFFVLITTSEARVREPAVAGSFYPKNPKKLSKMIQGFLDAVPESKTEKDPFVLIAPHAGFIYSGPIAAYSYKMLAGKEFDRVFVIAFSHYAQYPGSSIFEGDSYRTPLGNVPIDREAVQALREQSSYFGFYPKAHLKEHSLEVQLPFLQTVLPDTKIVPIVMGDMSRASAEQLVDEIIDTGLHENSVFIISTDFSHYESYETAVKLDSRSINFIEKLSIDKANRAIQNGKLSACGRGPILAAMLLADRLGLSDVKTLKYANSGDTAGDNSRVVGYASIMISKEKNMNESSLSEETQIPDAQRQELLKLARDTVTSYLKDKTVPEFESDDPFLNQKNGVFVTLHKNQQLRGCIGCFVSDSPLYKTVQDFVINSALRDPRFPAVEFSEVDNLDIEISVLSPMRKIDSVDEIVLGKHGIWIKKGHQSGTFLPSVATDTGWSLEEFLGHCAQDKAGIGWEGWKEAEIFVYTTETFSEADFQK